MASSSRNGNGNARKRRSRRNLRRPTNRGRSFPFWLKGLIALGVLGFAGLLTAFAVGVVAYRSYAADLVAPDELAINEPSYGAKIFDRNGLLLYEYVDDRSGLRRPVKLDQISDAFLAATIATEDDSFFTNPGVNIKGLARAAWENLSPLSGTPGVLGGSGGSSITQQLVKNVYIEAEERQKRSIDRKIKETVYAIELTQRYEKERILEWYVNQISYGGVYNGVEAASQGYFSKPASDLGLAEAALLAGIPQSPAAYDPVNHPEAAAARRNQILDLMERQGRLQIGGDAFFLPSGAELDAARAEEVSISEKRFPIEAPHFVLEYIQPQLEGLFGRDALFRDGLVVTTTIDIELQREAILALEKWIQEFEEISDSRNGAVVVIDPVSGEILTMIGSRDYFRDDIEGKNNNVTTLNSPGSAFKPFVYLTSFLELGWGPGTVILDTPVVYEQPDGTEFEPTNPAKDFHGPITIRSALGNSLNIPAVKAADQTGVQSIVRQAKRLGFTTLGGGYGPAIATGGVDLSVIDMAYGYSVLANGGVMRGQEPFVRHRADERQVDPISLLRVTDFDGRLRFDIETRRKEERIVDEEYVYLVTSILTDGSAQCITFGCGGITIGGGAVAVKTGTSEPFDPEGPNAGKIGDTWGFGYTPDLVVAVWAGNSDNSPIVNIFSTSISFRAMRDILLGYYDGSPITAFKRPAGVVEETLCVPSGLLPSNLCGRTTQDLFVADDLPEEEDDWWQHVRIDARNGLLAGPLTSSQYVRQEIMLVLPPALLLTEADQERALEWAEALGLPLAPTETSTASGGLNLPAIIFSPAPGAYVTGRVEVSGRATSRRFDEYRLEYASSDDPTSWTRIWRRSREVASGTLGTWDTDDLDDGVYVLRLVVTDERDGDLTATVVVNVGAPAPPGPDETP